MPFPPEYPDWYTPSKRVDPNRRVLQGRHPFGLDLGPDGATCGTCVHMQRTGRGAGIYLKCDLTKMSRSASSDLRAKWHGCDRWETAQ